MTDLIVYHLRACTESSWTKKVRSNIYKSRPDKSERLAAVYGFTGSVSASVLLDLLNEALDPNRSDLYVVHIDISAAMLPQSGWTLADNEAQHRALREYVDNAYDGRWKLDIVTLEEVLEMKKEDVFSLISNLNADKTSQEDMLSYLVRSALIRYSRQKNVHRVFTSESLTSLSVKAIASCAKGRGFQMAEESSLVEEMKDLDIIWAIPMKDNLTDREIAYYFRCKQLTAVPGPQLIPLAISQSKSINGLTNSFLTSLQRGFDHSMHTIMRSLEKLSSEPNAGVADGSKDNASSNASSSTGSSAAPLSTATSGAVRCSLCSRLRAASDRAAHPSLCFSCEKMLFKAQDGHASAMTPEDPIVSSLLNFQRESVLAPAGKREHKVEKQHQTSKRKQMREQISEFLLDHQDDDADLGALMSPEEE